MAEDFYIRPMRLDDVPGVQELTDQGFYDLDVRTHRTGWPEPSRRSPERAADWELRLRHLVRHDPDGCWVAESGPGLIGAVAAMKRDLTWVLATYAVRPGLQGRGVGKQLLDAALGYGRGCLRAMVAASEDPPAARRYRLAGFDLHPTMLLWGGVPRETLPVVDHLRDGSAGDIDLMNSVDRQVRGSAHGVDHEVLTRLHRVVVTDRPGGSGYAYIQPGTGPYLLAATNRRVAVDLLWESLASTSPEQPATVQRVTPANGWAVDVGMSARMELHTRGYLALRGMRPPAPYLPSGHFL